MSLRRLISHLRTSIAYDGGDSQQHLPAKQRRRVTLTPGLNVLVEEDGKVLDADPAFAKHLAAGHVEVAPDEPVVVAEAAPAPDEAPPVDPRLRLDGEDDAEFAARVEAWRADRRKKLPKENAATYKARIAAYDADDAAFAAANPPPPAPDTLTDDERKFVSDFFAMTPEEQEALRPTLTDAESKLLEANKPE